MAIKRKFVKKERPKVAAIIVAAGNATRFGGAIPKQYCLLNGKSVLAHSIEAFLDHPMVNDVLVVIHRGHRKHYSKVAKEYNLLPPAIGGKLRQESVFAGLMQLEKNPPDMVLVHDAARPYVSSELISRVINEGLKKKAVIPAVAISDSIKQIGDRNTVVRSLNREELRAIQTPQGFDFELIVSAHKQSRGKEFTDDAGMVEAMGKSVYMCNGEVGNIKITTLNDMKDQAHWEYRTGTGFDVHAFADKGKAKRTLKICGITVPHDKILEGHSDADVGLHALTDALLGAMAEGDLGVHFPPSDAKWKNADSIKFVHHALTLMKKYKAKLIHVDVTLIAEKPKISPLRDAMRKRVSEILDADITRVSIKATTTEKLGFTGREEGIAAQAAVTLAFPVRHA